MARLGIDGGFIIGTAEVVEFQAGRDQTAVIAKGQVDDIELS